MQKYKENEINKDILYEEEKRDKMKKDMKVGHYSEPTVEDDNSELVEDKAMDDVKASIEMEEEPVKEVEEPVKEVEEPVKEVEEPVKEVEEPVKEYIDPETNEQNPNLVYENIVDESTINNLESQDPWMKSKQQ